MTVVEGRQKNLLAVSNKAVGFLTAAKITQSYQKAIDGCLERNSKSFEMQSALTRTTIAYFKPKNTERGFTLVEILVTVLIVGILAAMALPSYLALAKKASPLCRRETCINRDPKDNKCDKDALTLKSSTFKEVKIELRYSPRCDAAWGRSTASSHSTIYVEDFQGQQYGVYKITPDKFSEHYGDMGPGLDLKACVQLPDREAICTND